MNVSQVMSKAVVIDDSISVKQAAKIMSNKNITNLIIVKEGKIKGIITDRDVLKNLHNIENPVRKVMSRSVVTIKEDSTIGAAGKLMASRKIKRLPVVKEGKLVGAVSFTDVIGHCSPGEGGEGDFLFN